MKLESNQPSSARVPSLGEKREREMKQRARNRRRRRVVHQNKVRTSKRKKRLAIESEYGWSPWSAEEKAALVKLCRKHGFLTVKDSRMKWQTFYKAFPKHQVADVRNQIRKAHAKFARYEIPGIKDVLLASENDPKRSLREIRNASIAT